MSGTWKLACLKFFRLKYGDKEFRRASQNGSRHKERAGTFPTLKGKSGLSANLSRVLGQTHGSRDVYLYWLLALSVFTFSLFIHSPCEMYPTEYSDLYSLFFQVFGGSDRWFAGTVEPLGIPYVHYRFEYPPIIAGIFYLTSEISLEVARWTGVPRSAAFYYALALMFVLPAYVAYLKAVNDTSKILGADRSRIMLAAAGFGIAYYVVYNFDIIAIAFAMFSLLLLVRGRERSAGLLLGLSVASKIITGIVLFPSLFYLIRRSGRSAAGYFLCFSLATVASFGPVYLLAFRGLEEMFKWHATWYCENCFYIMIAGNIHDDLWRLISQVFMVAVPVGLMLVTRHGGDQVRLIRQSLLMIPAAISVSYVYSPQMNVMIGPAYLLASNSVTLGTLALSDFLNVLIMVFFFRTSTLCDVLGSHSCPPPWGRESPVQWIAFSRIVLLWVFIAFIALRMRLERKHYCSESQTMSATEGERPNRLVQ